MVHQAINSSQAPQAVGTYSHAVRMNNLIFLSGQIPLDPHTMTLVEGGIEVQIHQVFKNLNTVIEAAGASFKNVVKLTIYMTDLSHFGKVNEIMAHYVSEPYPARATIGVKELPKGAAVEIEGILAV